MKRWVVIPIKATAYCKTRLSSVLGETGRQALVEQMLHRVYSAACHVVGPDRVLLLGPTRHSLPSSTALLHDPGQGLNPALASATGAALRIGIDRLLILSADLPHVQPDDVAAMLDVAPDHIAVAPDRCGQGTNALSLPLPQARHFSFRYGVGSFAAHRAEAALIALSYIAVVRPNLGFDIDIPEDLTELQNDKPHERAECGPRVGQHDAAARPLL